MTKDEVMRALEEMGSEQTLKTYKRHGLNIPAFGVKIGDMKAIQKKVKKDQQLAEELYETGNHDAMYLAGLIADEQAMSPSLLQKWAENASWYSLAEYTVAWITAESNHAEEMGKKWIATDDELLETAGWSTLANYISIAKAEEIDVDYYRSLLHHVEKNIQKAKNRVKYVMNNFVICVGSYIPELTEEAKQTASQLGKVEINMGDTACKVPDAKSYIEKIEAKNRIGKKRKQARC